MENYLLTSRKNCGILFNTKGIIHALRAGISIVPYKI